MDVSVIVPTFNEEKYIEKCLKSIAGQKTDIKYEIIVSDGSSTDNTLKIAKKYTEKIIISRKKGVWHQRNLGAESAQGKILVFIDADTELLPSYLETIINAINGSVIAVSTAFKFSSQTPELKFAETVTNAYFLMRDRIGKATLPGFNICILKDAFNKVGGFKNILLEDVEISKDLRKRGKTRYLRSVKVITSSRKLDEMGILGTLRYYLELDLNKNLNNKKIAELSKKFKLLKYHNYVHCR